MAAYLQRKSYEGVAHQLLLAAWATHELVVVDGQLRIKLKRVDLVNCDAALPNIQCFM